MAEISPETKGLVWDFDGTMLDSFKIFESLMREIAPDFGQIVPSHEELLDHYHGTLPQSIQSSLGGGLSDQQLDDFLGSFLEKQKGHYLDVQSHILEDAVDLSQRATQKEIKQAIVTNRDHEGRGNASPRSIVENTNLKDHIHEVICGDEVDYRKPDARVVGQLLAKWGLRAEQLTIIGDQFVDAQLAINLGTKAVIVVREGSELAHAHMLEEGWQEHVSIVSSLRDVTV